MIFCVEDDESIQSLELYALRSAGFEVRGFVDGDSFLEALRTEIPQLVILDVMLPGKSGVELLKLMKESSATREIAVIMATAKGAEYDKIQSLDLGADDYLVKPFGMMEMVSRVKAVLRRCHPRQNPEILAANDLVIDLAELQWRSIPSWRAVSGFPSPIKNLNCYACLCPPPVLRSPEKNS